MLEISDKTHRRPEHLPDQTDERFLDAMNDALLGARAAVPAASAPVGPSLFVAGGPRSGTTFLAQALCQAFDVSWVDNLAARFWKTPEVGVRLSRIVFGDMSERRDRLSFRSGFGRSELPWDIHGIHYFWMRMLGLDRVENLFTGLEDRGIDASDVCAELARIEAAGGAPVVYKGYYPSYFMRWFSERIPGSVFVLISRRPLHQARSIYRARIAYNGDPGPWWSMQPPEIEELEGRSPAEQIAGQVFGLRRFYAKQLAEHGVKAVVIEYEELISDPATVMEKIRAEVESRTGLELRTTGFVPDVRAGTGGKPTEIDGELEEALKAFEHWDEPWVSTEPSL